MPVFTYDCTSCGSRRDEFVLRADDQLRCECGEYMLRQFSPTLNLRLAPWMTRDAEESRARNRAWIQSPEAQAMIRSGTLVPDTSDRYCESVDGIKGSSSVIDRVEEGVFYG